MERNNIYTIIKLIIFSIITILFISSCSGVHQITRNDGTTLDLTEKNTSKINIAKKQNLLIAIAGDEIDDSHSYSGSGLATSSLIQKVFKPYFKSTDVISLEGELNTQLLIASDKGFRYLIIPKILTWQDHYTFWTGVPDKVSISLKLYNTKTRKQVEGFIITGESSLTPRPNQQPEDLLYEPLEQLTKVIFYGDKQKT